MHELKKSLAVILSVFALTGSGRAVAQCANDWHSGDPLPGVDGDIFAMTTWDPDGPGPESELLIVGGTFGIAGNKFVNNIAAWDGVDWHSMGSGVNGQVRALLVHQNALIVGGSFSTAGGASVGGIATWNGATWQAVGGNAQFSVMSLAAHDGQLVAGGTLESSDYSWSGHVARLEGLAWQPMGDGLNAPVFALCDHNGQLFAGGDFTASGSVELNYIARWEDGKWTPLGTGVTRRVHAFCVYHGELIVGGHFRQAGGINVQYVARWNGSSLNAIGNYEGNGPPRSVVFALAVFDDELYVGSFDNSIGGLTRWNGEAWDWDYSPTRGTINAMAVYRGEVIMQAFRYDGVTTLQGLLRWNGSTWRQDSLSTAEISGFARVNHELYAFGRFTTNEGLCSDVLAQWNGSAWQLLNSGLTGQVFDIIEFEGELVVVGRDLDLDGPYGPNTLVMRRSGSDWVRMDAGLDENSSDFRRLNVCGGVLYGADVINGGQPDVTGIARWTGSVWEPLPGAPFWGGEMTCDDGDLIAAVGQGAIARRSGNSWETLTNSFGIGHNIAALTKYQELLVAATYGGSSNDQQPHIFSWDDVNWHPLGGSIQIGVFDLLASGNDLIATGAFTVIGGIAANHIAIWDGATWSALGVGLDNYAGQVCKHDGDLFVAGNVNTAGGKVSYQWARWGPLGPVPAITQQPSSPSVCAGSSVSLRATAVGDGALTYRWRKDGAELVDGGGDVWDEHEHAGVCSCGRGGCGEL